MRFITYDRLGTKCLETIQNCFFRVVTENVPPCNKPKALEMRKEPLLEPALTAREDFDRYVHVDARVDCIEVFDIKELVNTNNAGDLVDNDEPEPPNHWTLQLFLTTLNSCAMALEH